MTSSAAPPPPALLGRLPAGPEAPPPVGVAVLGCGTVGAALVSLLVAHSAVLAVQSGAPVDVVGIAVADLTRSRPAVVPASLLTDDAAGLVKRSDVDVVVELIGGLDPAGALIRRALEAGKSVVTANKALLASPDGIELRTLARRRGVDLLYEASVAGAIPLVRALRESLTGERIVRVMGIVNGTTNFILSRMADDGVPYDEALAEAQRLGYAERDPTADVEGHDAAAKAAILAGVAFGSEAVADDVHCEGIAGIDVRDIAYARRFGYALKLLAVVERHDGGTLSIRVHPSMVPETHPLASVRGADNAVFIEGEAAGRLMLSGPGAGGLPTASAVVGDLIDAVRNRGARTTAPAPEREPARLLAVDELESAFYVRMTVEDRPGVLAAVAGAFGDHGVSIRSMEQQVPGDAAQLVFTTHRAREGALRATLGALESLGAVASIDAAFRIAGEHEP